MIGLPLWHTPDSTQDTSSVWHQAARNLNNGELLGGITYLRLVPTCGTRSDRPPAGLTRSSPGDKPGQSSLAGLTAP